MAWVDGVLLDIDGVLTVAWEAIPGASEALVEVRDRGVPLRFVTNTTSRTRSEISVLLRKAGFAADVEEILTAPAATAAYLRANHPGGRCFVLTSGDVSADLIGVELVTEGPADVVVIGGAGMVFTHDQLNHAFRLLLDGAGFVAMHRNIYWRTADGLSLDSGAYVMALEAATGLRAVVVGKPAPEFFGSALEALGLPKERVAMVGDDIVNDVLGAQTAGLHGVLVRTGKYRRDAVESADGRPEVIIDSVADLPELLRRGP